MGKGLEGPEGPEGLDWLTFLQRLIALYQDWGGDMDDWLREEGGNCPEKVG